MLACSTYNWDWVVLEVEHHLPILLEVKVTTEVRVIVLRENQDYRTEMSDSSRGPIHHTVLS